MERRGGRFTHARGGEPTAPSGFQGHGADGVTLVVSRRVRILLSNPLLCCSGPGRGLVLFPQPQVWMGFAKCRGAPSAHGVRDQAKGASPPTGSPGGLSVSGQGYRPLLLLALPSQWTV